MLRLENYNNGLIYTEVKDCIDCSKCIHECPILKSNASIMYDDGSYKMCVDDKECILCGMCINTCIHDVRHYRDDCGQFFEDLERGRNLSVIIAPSFRLNYPDEYKNILGYLRSCGVKNFYSVSLGANIAVWGYLNYIIKNKKRGHIAPPCPSVVRHIEKHLPELLPSLIPIQTPVMCTAVYLKKYKGVQEDLVLLSPCIAKKTEIQAKRGLGLVSHNVTFRNLMTYIKEQGVNLSDYHCDKGEGEDDTFGIGMLFPMPGGLRENVEYYMGRDSEVIQIEGQRKAYKYLDFLAMNAHRQDEHVPMLVDILNCDRGCLYGTGTELHGVNNYDVTYQALISRKKNFEMLRGDSRAGPKDSVERFALLGERFRDLKLEDFMCGYTADDINRIPAANDEEIEKIFTEKLMKLTENDKHVDCSACGYNTCRRMAEAIALGINHHDNCVYYTKSALAKSVEELGALEGIRLMEQRLKAVIDTSPILCSIFDENLNIIDINQAGVDLLELPDKQIFIDRFYEVSPEYQPDGTPTREKFAQMMAATFETGSVKFEWMHQTLNGETLIPCEVYIERVEFGGKPLLFAYVRDLREQKAMLAKLEDAVSREKAANAAKTKFLSTMSHEIRTPMNSVLGITELELQKDTHAPETEESFRRIFSSSNMLLSIINDILDLSKVEAGKMKIIPAVYELASMITDTIQLNLMYIGSKIIEFNLHVDERLPARLIGDELRIKQILNNLLTNAFKYTAEGSVSLSFEMETITEDDVTLIIKVRDTGPGMTAEQISQLFGDEFTRFSLQDNRTIEGSGLGLVITHRLIHIMGGEISVESQPEIGSTFTVTLPQKKIDTDILGKDAADKLQNLDSFQQSMKRIEKLDREPMPYGRILVVDDVESNLYVAKVLLMPYKIAISTAESGEIAISKVRDGQVYDIIFMDYMMPGMGGIETTRHLRDMGYNHPIVALTAAAVVGQAELLLSSGFDDFISKPIDVRQLDSILNKLVRDKQPPEVLEAARAQAAKAQAAGKELIKSTENQTTSSLLSGKAIDGLDISRGLERYDGNEEIYLKILQSYLHSMRSMIEPIEAFDRANLIDYKIKVHGVSGTSFDIFATDIGTTAKALENAAIDGDVDYINAHNAQFISDFRRLLDDMDGMLASINAEKPKTNAPVKYEPDANLLEALINACKIYDMSTVDNVVAEIEKYQYESDPKLAGWLRENADMMNFAQIIDRLNDVLSQTAKSPATLGNDFKFASVYAKQTMIFYAGGNDADLMDVASILEAQYQVLTMLSSDKMFALLKKRRPGLILLDMEMKEANGREIIAKLKQNPDTDKIPVIFLGCESKRHEALSWGAVEVISKTAINQELLNTVRKYEQNES